jgi:hypothetical protein
VQILYVKIVTLTPVHLRGCKAAVGSGEQSESQIGESQPLPECHKTRWMLSPLQGMVEQEQAFALRLSEAFKLEHVFANEFF